MFSGLETKLSLPPDHVSDGPHEFWFLDQQTPTQFEIMSWRTLGSWSASVGRNWRGFVWTSQWKQWKLFLCRNRLCYCGAEGRGGRTRNASSVTSWSPQSAHDLPWLPRPRPAYSSSGPSLKANDQWESYASCHHDFECVPEHFSIAKVKTLTGYALLSALYAASFWNTAPGLGTAKIVDMKCF